MWPCLQNQSYSSKSCRTDLGVQVRAGISVEDVSNPEIFLQKELVQSSDW